jgi:nucleoside-diphosphate-sugar epimerase
MSLLVTGATGFVMSVLTRRWLESNPHESAVILDSAGLDETAKSYFAPVADRLRVVQGDVTDRETWQALPGAGDFAYAVHGATITPIANNGAGGASLDPEAERPDRIIEVNVMGTVAALEWARTQPRLRRFIYVSSGSVYRNHGPDRPGEPLPEDGYVMPRQLYAISKFTSELITERYAELFGLPIASVRLSSVYGPMDRATSTRNFRHVPNEIAHKVVEGAKRVRVNSLGGVGDYIHSEDAARAIVSLLEAPSLGYSVYNIAAGSTATVADLVRWAAEKSPGFHAAVVPAGEAEIVQDDTERDGMWGAYDLARIYRDTGWKPRPVREAFHAYIDWLATSRRPGGR